ncbi:MAG: hypothetical protein O7A03_02300 [Alphaproteobacteria bacterium]|nr:hypothetical protein [Alphaproteobacteria bacterium]
MSEPRLGIHIGLPKTGSTSLQLLCFKHHPDLNYFGWSNRDDRPESVDLLKAILLEQDPPAGLIEEIIQAALAERPAIMISDEEISLGEFSPRATELHWPINADHGPTARRIHQRLGDAHIFIVLRNQADWLLSVHRQFLKMDRDISWVFDEWLNTDLGPSKERLFQPIDFEAFYDAYAEIFGPARVHVRLYEAYRDRLPDLAFEFTELLGVDAGWARHLMKQGKAQNVTRSDFTTLPRMLKKFERRKPVADFLDWLSPRARKKLRKTFMRRQAYLDMTERDRAAISAHFAPSNRRLLAKLGIDATGLGYF